MNLDTSPSKMVSLQTDQEEVPSAARSTQKRTSAKKQNFAIKLADSAGQ